MPVAEAPGRRRAFQYRASDADLAALTEAARLRGFAEGDRVNCSAYLRELVRADVAAARGDPRNGARLGAPGTGSVPSRGQPPPLAPALATQLALLFPQVQGACANLNQLLRDWHLVRQNLPGRRVEVTGERIAGVLQDLEGTVLRPLAAALGKPGQPGAPAGEPPRRTPAPRPLPAGRTPSTAERFRGGSPTPSRRR